MNFKKQGLTGIQELRALRDKTQAQSQSKPPSSFISYENDDFVKSSISENDETINYKDFGLNNQAFKENSATIEARQQKSEYFKKKAARDMKFKTLLCDKRFPKIQSKIPEKGTIQKIHSSRIRVKNSTFNDFYEQLPNRKPRSKHSNLDALLKVKFLFFIKKFQRKNQSVFNHSKPLSSYSIDRKYKRASIGTQNGSSDKDKADIPSFKDRSNFPFYKNKNLKKQKFRNKKDNAIKEEDEDSNDLSSNSEEQELEESDGNDNRQSQKKSEKKHFSKKKNIHRKTGDPFSMKMSTMKFNSNTNTWVYKSYWLDCIDKIIDNDFEKLKNEETVGFYSLVGNKLEMTREQSDQLIRANIEYEKGWSYISRVTNCCEFDFERENRIFKVHKPNVLEYELLDVKANSLSKEGYVRVQIL